MTKEEFILEMDQKIKELNEIKERMTEIRAQGDLSNEEYWQLRKRQSELNGAVEWYQKLVDKTTSYRDFIEAYESFLDYSKEHNLEEIPLLSDKVSFLNKHYKRNEQFKVYFNYYPPNIWDIADGDYYSELYLNKDLNNILNYFHNKKESDVYKWELEYVTLMLFYDQVCHTTYAIDLFDDYKELERTKECEEYVNNCDKIIKDLSNNTFSFNLLLWTIYKIYHYLRNQNSEFIVNKSDLILIDRLITLSLKITKSGCVKRTIKENKDLDEEEKWFIFSLSQLLCLDLIHTIYNGFPDYYDTCIMFLGYGLHIPAGCSDLDASMKTFERYVNDITDYDYWLGLDGPEMFEKMNIEYDYEEVLKDNDLI